MALVGSHNLSKAAWGVEEKAGTQLYIRSYEVSILLQDTKLVNKLVGTKKPYSNATPWHPDVNHTKVDDYGNKWLL